MAKPEHGWKSCVRSAEHKLRPSAQRTRSPFFFFFFYYYLPPAFLKVDKERKTRGRWECEKRGRRGGQRTDERRAVENEMERQRLVSSQVRMARGQGGGEGSGGRSGHSQKKHRNEQ